jgi:hypothetical protein
MSRKARGLHVSRFSLKNGPFKNFPPAPLLAIIALMPNRDGPFYKLDDHGNPIAEPDVRRWTEWFEHSENRVLWSDDLPDGVQVSTGFLGIDHNHSRRGPPILWGTKIFGGPRDQYCDRYFSRDDALKGHDAAVRLAKGYVS